MRNLIIAALLTAFPLGSLFPAAANPITIDVVIDRTEVDGVTGGGTSSTTFAAPGQKVTITKTHTGGSKATTSWFVIKSGEDLVDEYDDAWIQGTSQTNSGEFTMVQEDNGEIEVIARATLSGVSDESDVAKIELVELYEITVKGGDNVNYVQIGSLTGKDEFKISVRRTGSGWPDSAEVRWQYRRRDVDGNPEDWTDFTPTNLETDNDIKSGSFKPTECGEYQFRAFLGEDDEVGVTGDDWYMAFPKITSIIATEVAYPDNTITHPGNDSLYLFAKQNDKTIELSLETTPADTNGTEKYLRFMVQHHRATPDDGDFTTSPVSVAFDHRENDTEAYIYRGVDFNRDGDMDADEQDDYIYIWFIQVNSMTVVDKAANGDTATNPFTTEMTLTIQNGTGKITVEADIEGGNGGSEDEIVLYRVLGDDDNSLESGDFQENPTAELSLNKDKGPFRAQVAEDYNRDGVVDDDEVVLTILLGMRSDIKVFDDDERVVYDGGLLKVVPDGPEENITLTFTDPDLVADDVEWRITGSDGTNLTLQGKEVTFPAKSVPFTTSFTVFDQSWSWVEDQPRATYDVECTQGDKTQSADVTAYPSSLWEVTLTSPPFPAEELSLPPAAADWRWVQCVGQAKELLDRLSVIADWAQGPAQLEVKFDKAIIEVGADNSFSEDETDPEKIYRDYSVSTTIGCEVSAELRVEFPLPYVPSFVAKGYIFANGEASVNGGGEISYEQDVPSGQLTAEAAAKIGAGVGVEVLEGFVDVNASINIGAEAEISATVISAREHLADYEWEVKAGKVTLEYSVSLAYGLVEHEGEYVIVEHLYENSGNGNLIKSITEAARTTSW